jgi:signal transduction histidine kinase
LTTSSADEPLRDPVEDVARFPPPYATAISNDGHNGDNLRTLAVEQAALRRVATLVAESARPAEVFATVAREVGVVLNQPRVGMYRYEPDGTATVVGAVGEHPFQPGTNWPLDGPTLASRVLRTGRPARLDDYTRVGGTLGEAANRSGFTSGVGAPIVVDGELWGVVAVCAARQKPLPADAEHRLMQFTALVGTAISNTQAREDLRRLADEHAALRRLATLVAQGAEPQAVFDAVCAETGRTLAATSITIARFTSDGSDVTVAGWSRGDVHVPVGTRLPADDDSVRSRVRDTAASARVERYDDASGEFAELMRRLGIRSEAAAPVIVEGRTWGALIAANGPDPLPARAEQRLTSFAKLIAIALSNAAARYELVDSRSRIVGAAAEQRRQVVRDLHDGAQSRLIHAVIALEGVPPDVRPHVEEGLMHTRAAIEELRALTRGIPPGVLAEKGLASAIDVLADRAPLPVETEVPHERYPTQVESAAYFVVAEALANIAKHARASTAGVTVARTAAGVRLVVQDDGVGGATCDRGGGLAGLSDRLAALDGAFAVDSPAGGGTRIRAEIPLPASPQTPNPDAQ